MQPFYRRLVEIRHYLHQRPELSGKEFETTKFLKQQLEMLRIRVLETPLETGVIAEIGSGQPVIALRADIDALPIQEKTRLPFASQYEGVMHACGHDLHMTALLGAAELLKAREKQMEGTIRLIFQPAEEISVGATQVIEAGYIEDVQAIIAFHNMPSMKPNQIGFKVGGIMAGVEKFRVELEGKSTHAARPDLGIDVIAAMTSMIQNLQMMMARTVSPFDPAVLSIGHIEAGSTWNVIPKEGFFEGTIRSFNPQLQKRLRLEMTRIVNRAADSFGARVEIHWDHTPPVTYNDPFLTEFLRQQDADLGSIVEAAPSLAGEDFAFYQQRVPGVFAFIGSNGQPDAADLHSEFMTVDDAALEAAVPYYFKNALLLLEYYKQKL